MSKIATQTYANTILGGSLTSDRGATKQYLIDTFDNVDTTKLDSYTSSRLVPETNIVKKEEILADWSLPLTSDFIDSFGNAPTAQANVSISGGAALFSSNGYGYITYSLGNLLQSCDKAILQYSFNTTGRNNKHGGLSGYGDIFPGDRNYWTNVFINENGWVAGTGTVRGILDYGNPNKHLTTYVIPSNVWFTLRIEMDFVSNTSNVYLDGVLCLTTSSIEAKRLDKIMFGWTNHDSFRGYMKDISIIIQ